MRNGRIPAASLVVVQGELTLLADPAAAWVRLLAACRAATGVTLRLSEPFGAYRSIEAQREMWADPSTSTTGQVAAPGASVHGLGDRIDINNWESAARWLLFHARAYGWVRTIRRERWHFEYQPSRDRHKAALTITPPTQEDPTMTVVQMHWKDDTGKLRRIAYAPGTPWYQEWTEGGSTIANALAKAAKTGPSIPGTASMRAEVIRAAERCLPAAAIVEGAVAA